MPEMSPIPAAAYVASCGSRLSFNRYWPLLNLTVVPFAITLATGMNTLSDIAPHLREVEMKLVMSTTVAAAVLTLLGTGSAAAANKNCTNVVRECRATVGFNGFGSCMYWAHDPDGRYTRVSACISRKGCVPQFPPRTLN